MIQYTARSDAELMAEFEAREDRTSADFRAMRERIGWAQREVDAALGMHEGTTKKWESPHTGWDVRPYGWAWIDKMLEAHYREVDTLIAYALSAIEKRGISKGDTVRISYYRNGSPKFGVARTRHGEPAGAADAVSRAVGEYLEDEGYKVRYVWAEEGNCLV